MARGLLSNPVMSLNRIESVRRPLVLVVDDENGPREALRMVLSREHARWQRRRMSAYAARNMTSISIAAPPAGGGPICAGFASIPDTEVLIVSGRAGMDDAVRALRLGVIDLLRKPFGVAEFRPPRDELWPAVAREPRNELVSQPTRPRQRATTDIEVGHGQRVALHAGCSPSISASRGQRANSSPGRNASRSRQDHLPVDLSRWPRADACERRTIEQHADRRAVRSVRRG